VTNTNTQPSDGDLPLAAVDQSDTAVKVPPEIAKLLPKTTTKVEPTD
jgi:hypothetical protein